METLICIIGFLALCGLSVVGTVISLIVAMFKKRDETESTGEIDLEQQRKIE